MRIDTCQAGIPPQALVFRVDFIDAVNVNGIINNMVPIYKITGKKGPLSSPAVRRELEVGRWCEEPLFERGSFCA